MAYASLTQVAGEAKVAGGFSPTTNPTDSKVTEIISEVEAYVNAKVANKYVTPATDANAVLILRGISLALCAERVREIMAVKTGAQNVEQIAFKTTADDARKKLDAIVAGNLPLPNTALAAAPYDGVKSHAVTSGQQPFFVRGCDQW